MALRYENEANEIVAYDENGVKPAPCLQFPAVNDKDRGRRAHRRGRVAPRSGHRRGTAREIRGPHARREQEGRAHLPLCGQVV